MKKVLKILFIFLFSCFSFYYTNEIIKYSKSKDPIMKELKEQQKEKNVVGVNATIKDNEIISGKIGNIIDIDTSYTKMKSLGKYNENLLVFIPDYPDIDIKNNLDKYVVSGNKEEKKVSFMFLVNDNSYLNEILKILKSNNINSYFFIDGFWASNNIEEINKIKSYDNYLGNKGYNNKYNSSGVKYTNYLIKENGTKITYCYINKDDIEVLNVCKEEGINTIKTDIVDKNYPYKNIKKSLENGKIFTFEINKNLISELDISIKYIKQRGYKIIFLNELLNA